MASYLRVPPEVPYLWNDGPRHGIPFEWLVGFDDISEVSVGQEIETRERLGKFKGTLTVFLVSYHEKVFSGVIRWRDK